MRTFVPVMLSLLVAIVPAKQAASQVTEIQVGTTGNAMPWSHLQVNNENGMFRFAVVADHTGGHRPGVFMDALKKLNLMQPEFVLSTGDFIEGYTTDREELHNEWSEFNGMIDSLEMPFFYVPGNHDFMDKMTAEIWTELHGSGYYHFIYKNVLFLCLNTEESVLSGPAGSGIGKDQYGYIENVLAENAKVRWTMVFMHRPLWLEDDTLYWNKVETILAHRSHTVFAGHRHGYIRYERNNGKYYVLATTGGISNLQGPGMGEFDQLVWVTMTDKGPVIANLMLQGILDENVVTEDVQKLLTYQPVTINPVFTSDGIVRGDSITIRIDNSTRYPMWVALKFDLHAVIVPEIIELQKQLPAETFQEVKIPYMAASRMNVHNISPIRLYGKFLFRTGTGRDVEVSSGYSFLPVMPEYCGYIEVPVVVDGDLSEYKGFPFKGNSQSVLTGDPVGYTGDFDASFEFAVSCDESYLYVALSVWDDELVTDDHLPAADRDAIRLVIDARPVVESGNNRGEGNVGQYLVLDFPVPGSKKGTPVLSNEEGIPEKTLVSCTKTVQGADAEIAIPLDYLKKMNGENWNNFRLNLAYFDCDDNGPKNGIWWRPDWGSRENYTGSGTFFRIKK